MTLPDGPRGRALALALAVLTGLALWIGIATPALDWHASRAALLERRRALAQRMEIVAASVPQMQRDAAGLPAALGTGALLDGASDALAGAILQGRAEALSASNGLTPSSVELLPAEASGSYRRISLRLTMTGQWPALVRLLQSIEQASPRMLVDDLQINQSPSVIAGAAQPVGATFTVIGFRTGVPAR